MTNDLLLSADSGCLSYHTWFTDAFNTVSHHVLISRLSAIGITVSALSCLGLHPITLTDNSSLLSITSVLPLFSLSRCSSRLCSWTFSFQYLFVTSWSYYQMSCFCHRWWPADLHICLLRFCSLNADFKLLTLTFCGIATFWNLIMIKPRLLYLVQHPL